MHLNLLRIGSSGLAHFEDPQFDGVYLESSNLIELPVDVKREPKREKIDVISHNIFMGKSYKLFPLLFRALKVISIVLRFCVTRCCVTVCLKNAGSICLRKELCSKSV